MAKLRSFEEHAVRAANVPDLFEHQDSSIDKLLIAGSKLSAEVSGAILAADLRRTMEGASTLTIKLHDPDRKILNSSLAQEQSIAIIDGYRYALCKVAKTPGVTTLTFEDAAVAALRKFDTPRKANRAKFTRAQFVAMLIAEVKTEKIKFYAPELLEKQAIAPKVATVSQAARDERRAPGFASGVQITVKTKVADKTQLTNLDTVLRVGVELGMPKKVLITAIIVVTQESTARNLQPKRPAGFIGPLTSDMIPRGLFQQVPHWGYKNSMDPEKAAIDFYNKAATHYNSNTGMDYQELAEAVQRSGQGELYGQWVEEATATVEAYNGTSPGDRSITVNKAYEFTRGEPGGPKKENSWDCIGRLASEVHWNRFMSNGTLFFISDNRLVQSRPRLTIIEGRDTIEDFLFDYDTGKLSATGSFKCRATRWSLPPGSVIWADDQGAGSGRWLVSSIERSLFDKDVTVNIKRKTPKLKEPTNDTQQLGVGGDSGSIRSRIVAAAEKALKNARSYKYAQIRPYPSSLFEGIDTLAQGTAGPIRILKTDCSGFATLCYKAAGAKDPNASGFNGNGNTGTLIAHGTKTNTPRPGDLAFYGGTLAFPRHVAVYIGDGMCIGFGHDPITKHTLRYDSSFLGTYSYGLE